jgi:hypothetical protein
MSTTFFRLSPLPYLPSFLIQRAQTNEELQAALDDGLEDYTEGAKVILTALRDLLDDWLNEAREELYNTNQFTDAYKWLAINDHIAVVQAFRDLL